MNLRTQFPALSLILILMMLTTSFGGDQPNKRATGQTGKSSVVNIDATLQQIDEQIKAAFQDMDKIEKSVEEWGHAGISHLILMPDVRGRRNADDKRPFIISETGTDYEKIVAELDSKVQGGSAILDEGSLSAGIKGRAGVDEMLKTEQKLDQRKDQIATERLDAANKVDEINRQMREENAKFQAEKYFQQLEAQRRGAETATAPDLPESTGTPGDGVSDELIKTPQLDTGVVLPKDSDVARADADPATRAKPADKPSDDTKTETGFIRDKMLEPFGEAKFKDVQGLLNIAKANTFREDLALSPAQKFRMAGGAKVNESLMRFLADPNSAGLLADNQVLFLGVGTVSVFPGWRTREGYSCEVQVRPYYIDQNNKESALCPFVVSAFPLVEGQVLDLQYSKRRQFQFLADIAASYAAAGQTASAQTLLNYVRRQQQDVATRTMLPVVVPSSDGTQLTYRFDPTLQAVDDPSRFRGRPVTYLQPNNIPILVLLACERDELKEYRKVGFRTTVRWMPVQNRHWAKQGLVDWWKTGFIRGTRYDGEERYRNLYLYDKIHFQKNNVDEILNRLNKIKTYSDPLRTQELHDRFRTLETLAKSVHLKSELPQPLPYVEKVGISKAPVDKRDQGYKLSIQGGGFTQFSRRNFNDNLIIHVSVKGYQIPIKKLSNISENSFEAIIGEDLYNELNKPGGNSDLTVITKGGRVNYSKLDSNLVKEDPPKKKPQLLRISPASLPVVSAGDEQKTVGFVIELKNFPPITSGEEKALRMAAQIREMQMEATVMDTQIRDAERKARDLREKPSLLSRIFSRDDPDDVQIQAERETVLAKKTRDKLVALKEKTETAESERQNAEKAALAESFKTVQAGEQKARSILHKLIKEEAAAGELEEAREKIEEAMERVTEAKGNNIIHDWHVYIGGKAASEVLVFAGGERISAGFDIAGMAAGKYDIDVWRGNTAVTLEQGLEIMSNGLPEPEPELKVEDVQPKQGYIYASTWLLVRGSGFQTASGIPRIEQVLVEGRQCRFEVLSDATLVVVVPPWGKDASKPPAVQPEKKSSLTVVTATDTKSSKSELIFDLPRPETETAPAQGVDGETKILLDAVRARAARNQFNLNIGTPSQK